MAIARHPILAREGWVDIIVLGSAGTAVHYFAGWPWAIPIWVLLAFVTQFFRDPHRKIPALPSGIICPADGRVIAVRVREQVVADRDPLERLSRCGDLTNIDGEQVGPADLARMIQDFCEIETRTCDVRDGLPGHGARQEGAIPITVDPAIENQVAKLVSHTKLAVI